MIFLNRLSSKFVSSTSLHLILLFKCSPADVETSHRIIATVAQIELDRSGAEESVDNVRCACDVRWHDGATALLHQCCPVGVRDCQVVVLALNFKCSEL